MASTDEKKAIATPSVGPSKDSIDTFCPICGEDAADPSLKRFGEYFCSEAHVEEFAEDVRAKAATQAVATQAVSTTPPVSCCATDTTVGPTQQKGRLGGFLKMAACCGGMLLLLPAVGLVSAGGLAAVAGSALSVAAALACPIGMYFMMRGMMKQKTDTPPRTRHHRRAEGTSPEKPRAVGIGGKSRLGRRMIYGTIHED